MRQADWVFAAEVRSVAQARTAISQRLDYLPDEFLDLVLLLASELITNAVRHGTGPLGVHVTQDDRTIRVEVDDQSPEWPVVREIDRDALDGRGLVLVNGLASHWGVRAEPAGKTVWFTVNA
jgi:anti-sigma regulatory factor (Ser/Thr protein kinase)